MITQYLCTCTRSERFAAAHRKESAKDAAIRADEREKMPTGPWIEGDTPGEDGDYLVKDKFHGFLTDYYEKGHGWYTDMRITHYARINTSKEREE
jgi:hypothetical protein